ARARGIGGSSTAMGPEGSGESRPDVALAPPRSRAMAADLITPGLPASWHSLVDGRQTPRLPRAALSNARYGSRRLAIRPARSPALPTDSRLGGLRALRSFATTAAASSAGTPLRSSRSIRLIALVAAAP